MKGAAHIVERQHAIFTLNVLNNGTPMLMIVELRTQNFKTETECPCLFVYLIYNLYLASSYLVLVVDETSQDVTTKGKAVVVDADESGERVSVRISNISCESGGIKNAA